MHRSELAVMICALAYASAAMAFDHPILSKKLLVIDKLVAAGKAKTVYLAKDSLIKKAPGEDVEQISARLDITYGNGSAAGSFILPAGAANGWVAKADDAVAKYVNKQAPAGPTEAKAALIRHARVLKLVGKGLGDIPLDIVTAGDPAGPVFTRYCVTSGGIEHCHCSEFTDCRWKTIAGDTGAKLACRAGTWADCPSPCLLDQGLTMLDTCTNLEWEKKDTEVGSGTDPGNAHDVDNLYSWTGQCSLSPSVHCQPNPAAATTCTALTGGGFGCGECGGGDGVCDVDPAGYGAITTVWDWLNQLNGMAFAGHTDWRLPTMSGFSTTGDAAELESIIDRGSLGCFLDTGACIDSTFGPALAAPCWSASATPTDPNVVWFTAFQTGNQSTTGSLGHGFSARAVRSGS